MVNTLAAGLFCRSGSCQHWSHVSAVRLMQWPESCCYKTMWWAGGGGDVCCAQTPLDDSDPCLKQTTLSDQLDGFTAVWTDALITSKDLKMTHFYHILSIYLRANSTGTLPKNRACNSNDRCMLQSSLTLWSTTISVMRMTAMLHLY